MYKQIIFDMDGTLYSSENMILPTYERGIKAYNEKNRKQIPIPKLEDLLSLLGFTINDIYLALFPDLDQKNKDQIQALITNELITAIKNKEGQLFPGVEEIIKGFYDKGYQLFIASNGNYIYLEAILQSYDLFDFFHPIITLDYKNICSKGDILIEYHKLYDFDRKTTVMIGDRDSDWDAAKKLDCDFIGCDYGHGDKSEIESAENIVRSFKEITKWIY